MPVADLVLSAGQPNTPLRPNARRDSPQERRLQCALRLTALATLHATRHSRRPRALVPSFEAAARE